jgi:hypothetical protein
MKAAYYFEIEENKTKRRDTRYVESSTAKLSEQAETKRKVRLSWMKWNASHGPDEDSDHDD